MLLTVTIPWIWTGAAIYSCACTPTPTWRLPGWRWARTRSRARRRTRRVRAPVLRVRRRVWAKSTRCPRRPRWPPERWPTPRPVRRPSATDRTVSRRLCRPRFSGVSAAAAAATPSRTSTGCAAVPLGPVRRRSFPAPLPCRRHCRRYLKHTSSGQVVRRKSDRPVRHSDKSYWAVPRPPPHQFSIFRHPARRNANARGREPPGLSWNDFFCAVRNRIKNVAFIARRINGFVSNIFVSKIR